MNVPSCDWAALGRRAAVDCRCVSPWWAAVSRTPACRFGPVPRQRRSTSIPLPLLNTSWQNHCYRYRWFQRRCCCGCGVERRNCLDGSHSPTCRQSSISVITRYSEATIQVKMKPKYSFLFVVKCIVANYVL